jgi:hypothetical protein
MVEEIIYSGKVSKVRSAAGVSGVLIKLFNGGYAFRVYDENHNFIDYNIKHDDLSITIESDELASFYTAGDNHYLDHSPEVLGLDKVKNKNP